MAVVCAPSAAVLPEVGVSPGNSMARHLRLMHDDTSQLFPKSAASSKPSQPNKFMSVYKVDFKLHPLPSFLSKSLEVEKPKRLTIRDVLFGNSPSDALKLWKIPDRFTQSARTEEKKTKAFESKEVQVDSRPTLQRQTSLPAIALSSPKGENSKHVTSAPPIRFKVTVDEKAAINKTPAQIPATEHRAPSGSCRKETSAGTAGKVRNSRRQLYSVIRASLFPDVRRRLEKWLETASDTECQVAFDFFNSMAGTKQMGSTREEQRKKLKEVIHTLEKSKPPSKTKVESDEPNVQGKETKLKFINLLEPEVRANRWMHTTWHHMPEYTDNNPGNNWKSHYTRPHAPVPRHFVLHPDWC
ncbi:uncharacterized protein LOC131928036 [Physella acuta]|uniref:uncharacterized protein LOC131928036 n=1 Tax=Physella acuta TaxID=109671 RepID=UPI0027DD1474|nr:uncharacterized protein LOC131928036 [Physella acuta]